MDRGSIASKRARSLTLTAIAMANWLCPMHAMPGPDGVTTTVEYAAMAAAHVVCRRPAMSPVHLLPQGPSNPIPGTAGQCPGDKLVPPSDLPQKKEASRPGPSKSAMIRNGPCPSRPAAGLPSRGRAGRASSTGSESNQHMQTLYMYYLGNLPDPSELLAACTALVRTD